MKSSSNQNGVGDGGHAGKQKKGGLAGGYALPDDEDEDDDDDDVGLVVNDVDPDDDPTANQGLDEDNEDVDV